MKKFACGLMVTVLCLLGLGPGTTGTLFALEDPGRGRSSPLKREGRRARESFEEKLLRIQIESQANRIARWDPERRRIVLRKKVDLGGPEPLLEMILNRAFHPDNQGLLKLDRKIPLAPVIKIFRRFVEQGGLEKVEKIRRAFRDLKKHKLGEHYGIIPPEHEKGKRKKGKKDIWVRRGGPPRSHCPYCRKMDRVYRFIRSAVHNLFHERWLRQKEGRRKKIIIRRREHREDKLRPGKRDEPRVRIEIRKRLQPEEKIRIKKKVRIEKRIRPGKNRGRKKKARKLY